MNELVGELVGVGSPTRSPYVMSTNQPEWQGRPVRENLNWR